MKINSNTFVVKKGSVEYDFIEKIISKLAADNSIEGVDYIDISLSPNTGFAEFKTALDTSKEVPATEQVGDPQGQSNLPVPAQPAEIKPTPGIKEEVVPDAMKEIPGAPGTKEQEITPEQVDQINKDLKAIATMFGESPEGAAPNAPQESALPKDAGPVSSEDVAAKVPGEINAPQPQTA